MNTATAKRLFGINALVAWLGYGLSQFINIVDLVPAKPPTEPVLLPPRSVPPCDPDAVFPEYLAVQDPADRAAAHVVTWLRDPAARAATVARIETVAATVAHPGSARRAAAAVLAIAAGTAPVAEETRRAA